MEFNVTEGQIAKFLAVIETELTSHKRLMELYAPQLAPGFNAVDCLYPNENRLSAVIAMLLDPKGGHGQGATFFRLFLEVLTEGMVKEDRFVINLRQIGTLSDEELQISRTEPGLEVATTLIEDDQRRIDILLHFNTGSHRGFGLAIENKPWAMDQPRQIEAYDNYLRNRYNSMQREASISSPSNFVLIYLSGNGQPPGEESVSKSSRSEMEAAGRFIVMSYSQLKEWCFRCAEKCKAPRLRYFLEDFGAYIRDKFEGEIPVIKETLVVDQAIKLENISAAVAIGYSWPAISKALIRELAISVYKMAVINGVLDKNWGEPLIDFDFSSTGTGFMFRKTNWSNYAFAFSFEETAASDFFYGIFSNGKKNDLTEIFKRLESDSNIGKSDGSTVWYPWYQNFREPFNNWNESETPWVEIKNNGKTVEMVVSKLTKLIEHTSAAIDKLNER